MGSDWRRTFERGLGGSSWPAPGLGCFKSRGHHPLAFERGWTSDGALIRRLAPAAELPTSAGGIHSVAWSNDGALLASAGEDCRVLVWDAYAQRRKHSLDLVCLAWPLNLHACVRALHALLQEVHTCCS